jgi:hypothetical protein
VLDRPVEHLCGEDRYDGEYRLLDPDTLLVRWRVTGPAKDLEIETTYRREHPLRRAREPVKISGVDAPL